MRVIEAEKLVLKDLRDGTYLLTREAILNAPTFEAEPTRFGEWIPVDEKNDAFDCSECDAMVSKRHNYCPNCGAKMGIKGIIMEKSFINLKDVYRIIAGHSDYHGDNILSALTCLAEGKEVDNVKPLKIKTGHWIWDPNEQDWGIGAWECSECGELNLNIGWSEKIEPLQWMGSKFCPNCGIKMIKG